MVISVIIIISHKVNCLTPHIATCTVDHDILLSFLFSCCIRLQFNKYSILKFKLEHDAFSSEGTKTTGALVHIIAIASYKIGMFWFPQSTVSYGTFTRLKDGERVAIPNRLNIPNSKFLEEEDPTR